MISPKLASLALVLLLVLQVAIAQPYGKRHDRRDVITTTITVYIDQYGNTLDAAQYNHPATTAASPPNVPAPAAPTTEAATTTSPSATPTPESTAPTYVAPSSPAGLDTSGSVDKGVATPSGLSKPGIVYNPYNADGTCKSTADVATDIGKLTRFGVVRIYGVDCNQVSNVLAAAMANGMQVFIGVYDMPTCDSAVAGIITSVGKNWSYIYAIAIGNELVNGGQMSAGDVVAKVNSSRGTLRAAGYNGPVVTVDTWVAIIANPILCQNSDFVAANCHPFFDGGVTATGAGQFMTDSVAKIKAACGGKDTIITETGWPHQGSPNRLAVPGVTEQNQALTSIWGALGPKAFYFTSFDDLWKQDNAYTFGTEKYWGIQNMGIF